MSTYVLVHGAWHGAWCWYRIIARLRRASHRVIAPDLLGLGLDCAPSGRVTLERWTRQIARVVESSPEPVVLVGHSCGGVVLSTVAERIPERIRTLAYVTAYLLEDGVSVQDAAAQDKDSLIQPALEIDPERRSATLRAEAVREMFYGQCNDEDVALAMALLKPQPLAPLAAPARVSLERFGRVPRVYVECTADRAISHTAQRQMQSALPCQDRIVLNADHSPFFSRADELARVLLRI